MGVDLGLDQSGIVVVRFPIKAHCATDDDQSMNTSPPRCSVPGSSCRLLQLELPDPRPVWAALDAAGSRHFTGELTLHLDPVVHVWFVQGEVYLAERDTDPPLAQRLLDAGVVTHDDLLRGTVTAGDVPHLGRLFNRVPTVDRDLVELTVELQTATVLGEIADHVVPSLATASYRQHPSGVQRWCTHPATDVVQHRDTPAHDDVRTPDVPEVVDLREDGDGDVAKHDELQSHAADDLPILIDLPSAPVPVAVRVPVPPPASTIPASVIDEVAALALLVAEQAASFPVRGERITAPAPAEIEEPVATEAPVAIEAPRTTYISTGALDLTRIIEQVAAETEHDTPHVDGAAMSPGADEPLDISDDVRAAVRQALAEIEAATRPALTDGISVASLLTAGPAAMEHDLGAEDRAEDHREDHDGDTHRAESFIGIRLPSLPR